MKDLENVIPNPLNKNMTINRHYSYNYITSYVKEYNDNNESKLSTYYYAIADFSGLESTNFLSKNYNCQAIRNIPKQTYRLNSNFYIPAIGELSMAMEKVQLINNILNKIDKKPIDLNKIFISSTFYDPFTVWDFNMNYAKISYNDIYSKRSVLPFFRYEPLKNNVFDYESNNITNEFKDFNLFITLKDNHSFDEYVFANYYKQDSELISSPYPIYENNHIFVGMPYKNENKKDKLKFYIVIPTEPILGTLTESEQTTISNFIQQSKFTELTEYTKNHNNVNPFFKNLLIARPNYYKQVYIEGIQNFNFNINYIKCIIYTFEKYLDIFELKYREIFELSNSDITNCAEYIDNKKKIKFDFNKLGYFDKEYCLAIGIELRYYKTIDNSYNIIYRNFFFYNNYNIWLSFMYTNKMGVKYLKYTPQYGLPNISEDDLLNANYVYVNNYQTNNNDLRFFLSNYPKNKYNNNILFNSNNEIKYKFSIKQYLYSYSNNTNSKYKKDFEFTDGTLSYYIRNYIVKGKNNGVFGKIITNNSDVAFSDISQLISKTVNIHITNKTAEIDEISFNPYSPTVINQSIQHDIIFVKRATNVYKKIIISNNTNEHINIWIEDEFQRLCVNKTRLCIPSGYKFITYATIFEENYFIKFNIELYNNYKFTTNNKSYMNICINENDSDSSLSIQNI